MQPIRGTTQLIGGLVLAVLSVAPLAAQQSQLFTWRGTVDDDLRIAMRAGNIQATVMNGLLNLTSGFAERSSVLPQQDGIVRVQTLQGRGTIQVIQQPSLSNGYTVIVQIKDAEVGAAPYSFATYFEPSVAVGPRGQIFESVGGEVSRSAGEPIFRWSGNVDGDLQITLRRGRVGYDVVSGDRPSSVSANVLGGGVPERDGRLALSARQARGTIMIVQQPSAANGFTAIIRVSDTPGGFGFYDFDVIWR